MYSTCLPPNQKREKIPRAANESRNHTPKQRRATGDSVNRPRAGSRAATGSSFSNATSAPRPIPKKKTAEATTGSSAYSFDDTIDNPFKPSTPSSFTPSMEPTGFFKPAPSLESTSLPTESFMKSAARKPATSDTPEQGDPKPFKATPGRSRDASVSSMRPNHDDMILPAVARRIKEQGLHEHDVIAYSDAYDAPLYKLPSSPAYENNPFASYDRAKAVSSSSLAQPKPPEDSTAPVSKNKKNKNAGTDNDSEMAQEDVGGRNRRRSQTGPPVPEISARASIDAPSSAESPSERASRSQRGGVSRSSSRRQRRQQQEQYEQSEQRRLQEQYEQHEQPRQQEQYGQHEQRHQQKQYEQQQEQSRQQEQYGQHEQLHQQPQQNARDANSAQDLRPERPRRTRRNTDRQQQSDSPAYNEEPMPRRERRPTMPGNEEGARTNGSDSLYQQQSHYQSHQGHQGHQGAQKEWNDSNDPYSRQQRQVAPPESWDRRRPTNGDVAQQSSYGYQPTNNRKNGPEMAQYGAQDEMSRQNQRYYAGDQMQAPPAHRDARGDYRHQQGYNQEQGYRHQPQDDYKYQGTGPSQHTYQTQTQHPNASRPSYPQPEMVQVEMSQLDPGPKEDEQHGAVGKNNPSQENIKKKKEALCCIIC
ncbi:hypothetical protein EC968_010429 [Mortierella alpina]|nr:hypothetical protein EC968_010429 [Mortierella alpina]